MCLVLSGDQSSYHHHILINHIHNMAAQIAMCLVIGHQSHPMTDVLSGDQSSYRLTLPLPIIYSQYGCAMCLVIDHQSAYQSMFVLLVVNVESPHSTAAHVSCRHVLIWTLCPIVPFKTSVEACRHLKPSLNRQQLELVQYFPAKFWPAT